MCLLELAFWHNIQYSISRSVKYWLEMWGGSGWISWAILSFVSFIPSSSCILRGGCSYPVSVLSGLDFLLCWKGRAFQKREKQSQGKVCLCLITSVGELLNMYISATGKVSNRVMSSWLFLYSFMLSGEAGILFFSGVRWFSKMEPAGRACCSLGSCFLNGGRGEFYWLRQS